jgi:hypothetical protein
VPNFMSEKTPTFPCWICEAGYRMVSAVACTLFNQLLCLLLSILLSGCRGPADDEPVEASLEQQAESVVLFDWDLGVVPPATRHNRKFAILNSSKRRWNVARVTSTCGCTVAGVNFQQIAAGREEIFGVDYTAPSDAADDNRRVSVVFRERFAPRVIVHVRATVRPTLTATPNDIHLRGYVGEPGEIESHFTVQNFSTEAWNTPVVRSNAPWLACRLIEIPPEALGQSVVARQAFRVAVTVETDLLDEGSHRATVTFFATNEEQMLPVTVVIAPLARTLPQKLFFGNVARNSTATRAVRVLLAPCLHDARMQLRHSLGRQLKSKLVRQAGKPVQIVATLQPTSIGSLCDLPLTLEVYNPASGEKATIAIPIIAEVHDDE